jgi:hypothetical protein
MSPAEGRGIRFPHPGAWRTLAEIDSDNADHVVGVARRYGGLTEAAIAAGGESLLVWQRLVADLSPLAGAWDQEGALGDRSIVQPLEQHAKRLFDRVVRSAKDRIPQKVPFRSLAEPIRSISNAVAATLGSQNDAATKIDAAVLEALGRLVRDTSLDSGDRYDPFEPDGFEVAVRCPDMATFWQMQAIYSIAVQTDFRRCSWCGWWFSLQEGRRSDRKYCSDYHRTAAAAGRRAPQRFWSEAC